MTDSLNPQALKFYRNQRGWSQDQLAEATKLRPSKTQISRWERGQQIANIRPDNRERLCQALGVKWEQLTRAPKEEDGLKWRNRVPLKGGIDGSARTFLTLVQKHLSLTEDAIMDLAPLAVLILAEHSLHARQTALDETVAALEAATAEAYRRLPYLPGAFRYGYDDDWIEAERKSLEKRDLFVTYQDDDRNEHSPFINFLHDELKTLGLFQKHPIEFEASYSGATPEYAVPTHVLGDTVGLDPDNEADQRILYRIQDGRIDLREVWEKNKATGAEEYRRWLDEMNQAATEELASRFELPRGFCLKIKLPGDRSPPAATGSAANQGADIDNTDTGERT
ncbi:helix-turn-helix transcriptional regulator [uncultured Lamprocystis sp.]|jgi:transcriptional regulator with XRE-family HTH domain|uniref:helix-turn-helix domain-containing protein n=1 Tax=uncultured Lamprocystis sp. TaxID=543132 RepID=UPI0025F43E1B|nr:helix-turn-helix transcriptional regulator [uncultured Lamprocystis sp.]